METIGSLMATLEPDRWRAEVGFTPEIQTGLDCVAKAKTVDEIKSLFSNWIRLHQPCLFGRIAAKQSAITYCLIPEQMLSGDEAAISDHIQKARLEWTAAGFEGKSSNFIIAVLSNKLALALPNDVVKKIALKLASLYLQEDMEPDRVYLDRLWLEQPGSKNVTWEWVVGVNYFSAQGDGRWWRDHRFPAGMAFSMNSVGHMVKSGRLSRAIHDLEEAMGTSLADYKTPNVDSLGKALELAMGTIHKASDGISGKATFLLPASAEKERPGCPVELPNFLKAFDYCYYKGFYHTDFTIPSEYFLPDVARPQGLRPYLLDFTYLFHRASENPDHDRMGEGRRIREPRSTLGGDYIAEKEVRGAAEEVPVQDVPRLLEALSIK